MPVSGVEVGSAVRSPLAVDVESLFPTIVASLDLNDPGYSPRPIDPNWVTAGAPVAESVDLVPAARNGCSAGLWRCSAGAFDWTFPADEVVRILHGEVRLRFADRIQTAKAGDVVGFRGGTTVHWTIPERIEKFWVLGPAPTRAQRVIGKVRRLRAR